MTNGAPPGTNGEPRHHPWPANPARAFYAVAGATVLGAVLVNIFSTLHDAPRLPAWKPVAWELTSLVATLCVLWLPLYALRRAPVPTPRWGRALAVHLAAASIFSALHCLGMWTLRRAVYTVLSQPYGWTVPPGQILYEYRKDLFTYAGLTFVAWSLHRIAAASAAPAAPVAAGPALLDIRDGARLVRAPLADIVAAESAGNYVTILLRDGTRPLMRTTLAALEAQLSPHGFLRVHRSWIANPALVRAVEPTGAGDYKLVMEGGIPAPLSRRYAAAVQAIKGRK